MNLSISWSYHVIGTCPSPTSSIVFTGKSFAYPYLVNNYVHVCRILTNEMDIESRTTHTISLSWKHRWYCLLPQFYFSTIGTCLHLFTGILSCPTHWSLFQKRVLKVNKLLFYFRYSLDFLEKKKSLNLKLKQKEQKRGDKRTFFEPTLNHYLSLLPTVVHSSTISNKVGHTTSYLIS